MTSGTDYVIDNGSYEESSNSQTTTLTVKAGTNTADATFSCVVTSAEWSETVTDKQTEVTLNVFGKTG